MEIDGGVTIEDDVGSLVLTDIHLCGVCCITIEDFVIASTVAIASASVTTLPLSYVNRIRESSAILVCSFRIIVIDGRISQTVECLGWRKLWILHTRAVGRSVSGIVIITESERHIGGLALGLADCHRDIAEGIRRLRHVAERTGVSQCKRIVRSQIHWRIETHIVFREAERA